MKKRYYFLIGFLALLIAGAGYIYYLFEMKEYDIADEEVEEISSSEFVIDLPVIDDEEITEVEDGSPSEKNSSDTNQPAGNTGTTSSNNSSSNTPSNSTSNTGTTTNNEPAQKTKVLSSQDVINRYSPTFDNLEAQANERINQLIGRAYNEYSTKKNNNETISFGYFYSKYTAAANQLEAQADAAFNSVYAALQNDLERHGHSRDAAAHLKTQYESAKESRRNALLAKVKENI